MANKNFHTFIDFGKSAIRAISFNKETKKVENQLELTIKNNQLNNTPDHLRFFAFFTFPKRKIKTHYISYGTSMVISIC